jgi:ribonuclease HI
MVEYFCFSDGGCINNGKKNAMGSFSSIFIDGVERRIIRGIVYPYKYYLNDENFIFDESGRLNSPLSPLEVLSTDTNVRIPPSNNRGELLGIIYSFVQLLNSALTADAINNTVEVYSDSEISVNTFNIWLPDRRKKNTAHQMKNFDLLIIAEYLLDEINKRYKSVKLIHTYSHQDKPLESQGKRKLFIWLGNKFADSQCSILLNGGDSDEEGGNVITIM